MMQLQIAVNRFIGVEYNLLASALLLLQHDICSQHISTMCNIWYPYSNVCCYRNSTWVRNICISCFNNLNTMQATRWTAIIRKDWCFRSVATIHGIPRRMLPYWTVTLITVVGSFILKQTLHNTSWVSWEALSCLINAKIPKWVLIVPREGIDMISDYM